MFRRFFREVRGNYAMITAIAMVPIMGGLALAIDYSEMTRQRQATLNALDAAGIATARLAVEGADENALLAYAHDFFEANLGPVSPADVTLDVVLPSNNSGGGTLSLSAHLDYKPYFYPAFAAMLGKEEKEIKFNARTEVRLKNTIEVALVLDNSGSMNEWGSGSGGKRIDLLKAASKKLVDTIADQAAMMRQVDKPVQFGLVPFAASVNVGPEYSDEDWMDTDGISPIHHENFDWRTMSSGDRRVEPLGGVHYKRGEDWGEEEGNAVTRFTLYDELKRITGYTEGSGDGEKCRNRDGDDNDRRRRGRRGRRGHHGDDDDCDRAKVPEYDTYASWQGCVEMRPHPYGLNDARPVSGTPETLFVPMFAPDESDSGYYRGDWWPDNTGGSDAERQAYMPKYFEAAENVDPAGMNEGPNASCTTAPITPLTDVSTAAGKDAIEDAINAMHADGNTNVPQGMSWGWRLVSSGEPFTEGRSESERGNDKVVIVLTDGANTYSTARYGRDDAGNKSTYAAYGYAGKDYGNTGKGRIFLGTDVNPNDHSAGNYTNAMNEHFAELCNNAKDAGIMVMTVALDLSSHGSEGEQIDSLEECASVSRFRKDDNGNPEKLFWNATSGDLDDTFEKIADELSNLRIVG